MWVLYRFSDLFYVLTITIVPYRKKVIYQNIKNAFPEKNDKEIKVLVRKFYKHFADILIEGIKNLTISKSELSKRMIVDNPEVMDDLYQKSKNVILVSGHFNNWEWLITAQNFLFKHQAMGIGMPLTSKFWDKKVNQRRERFGMKVVHAKNFKDAIHTYKSTPIALLVLGDQSPGDSFKSYWMPFLNQMTAVQFGTEQIANEFDFAVVYFETVRIKRGYYNIKLQLITENAKTLEYGSITESHTQLLEKSIQHYPANWLWSHKRWKRTIPQNLENLKILQREKFNQKFR
jgi:KDO2-lipid IV(A) lauroyltransferase